MEQKMTLFLLRTILGHVLRVAPIGNMSSLRVEGAHVNVSRERATAVE